MSQVFDIVEIRLLLLLTFSAATSIVMITITTVSLLWLFSTRARSQVVQKLEIL